ncbi:ral guanine nucleotide dissociation stimulator-like [Dipodomys spectabilis]|uniref:ral guanine nucleotide dissociation stimulator-like n=1 Tax=Dipodomys spectabilis TaxID=105255 RepID=UPI001C541EBD|nr:ral guanine nucleotide dissociation stimulator-like [Dipodomys spectabilis]
MRVYPECCTEAPDTSCLQDLGTYSHCVSVEEQQAHLLLSQLEHMHLKEPELEAVPPTARQLASKQLDPTPCVEAGLPCQSELELAAASEASSAPGAAVELQQESQAERCCDSPAPSFTEIKPPAGQPMAHSLALSPAPSLDLGLQHDPHPLSGEEKVAAPPVAEELSPLALGPVTDEGISVPTPEPQVSESQADPLLPPSQGEAYAVQPEASKPTAGNSSGPELEAAGEERWESTLLIPGEQVESCPLAGEAGCLEPVAEQPEPPAQEPLPPNPDVAPVPSAQLDADAGLGGDSDPVTHLHEVADLHEVAEDTNGVLTNGVAKQEPACKEDRPAESDSDSDPWQCFDMGDVQISSRESDHKKETAHMLEQLPDLKVKQLSLMAVKLFKGLIPEQCLSYIYYQPDQEEGLEHLAPTVLAILEHCEKLHTCVISTCLGDHSTEAAERAQVLEHWIDVALECHLLKNSCTLVSITCALQSSQLQGLKKTWGLVGRESLKTFQELKKMYCHEQVYKRQEAKHMTLWKKLKRGLRKPQQLEYPEGTVPYLGTILTHLASLHKDKHSKDGSWLNIKRRREEFKVMALMKELQGSCQELQVVPDMNFVSWFNNMNRLNELESSKLSRELEPPRRVLVLSWNNKRSPPLRKRSGNARQWNELITVAIEDDL